MQISSDLSENINYINNVLPLSKSFDLITRELEIGNTKAYFVCVNGFCKFEVLQQILSDLQNPIFMQNEKIDNIRQFLESKIGYGQAELVNELETTLNSVLSGPAALFLDGFDEAIVLDARTYPTRGVQEPDAEKVIKGAKDGFVETLLFNCNLIRRRIRSYGLTFAMKTVGKDSKTDVAIAYVEDLVDQKLLLEVEDAINNIDISSLTMGSKSLEEILVPKKWYSVMPSMHSTQRSDVACSYLLEGYIAIIVDNSPVVLILPATVFEFTQSPEDYYKNPVVGTYFRCMRFFSLLLSLFLLPIFLLIGAYHPDFASKVNLSTSASMGPIELFILVLIVEFGLDLFKYASSHSTDSYAGSMSIIGGLIVGDIAIQLKWGTPEVIFYGAITMLATLSLSSIDLGEGLRIYRLFLIFCTGFLGDFGFITGVILIVASIVATPVFGEKSYLWPLYPMNWGALKTILFRFSTPKEQPSNIWNKTKKKE